MGTTRTVRPRTLPTSSPNSARAAAEPADDAGHRRPTCPRPDATVACSASKRWRDDASAQVASSSRPERFCVAASTSALRHTSPAVGREKAPATHLAEQLEQAGLTVARFKTGTPPRIDGRSVDYSRARATGERDRAVRLLVVALLGNRSGARARRPDIPPRCRAGSRISSADGKRIIKDNIAKSAMYGGVISSRGPRYCPSVEDKIVKFPDAERHQLFLEPEGHDTSELYVNGLSTSLPAPVQLEILRSVAGLVQRTNEPRRLRDRIRLLPADSARFIAAGKVRSAVFTSPDRSTAPRATRKQQVRGW